MAYQKRNFKKDQLLTADDLNAMDDQIALNEESAKKNNQSLKDKFDKSSVVQEEGDSTEKVMSQKAVTEGLKNLSDNKLDKTRIVHTTGSAEDMVISQRATTEEFEKKFNKSNVVQSTGYAEDKVMSQASATKEFDDLYRKTGAQIVSFLKSTTTNGIIRNSKSDPFGQTAIGGMKVVIDKGDLIINGNIKNHARLTRTYNVTQENRTEVFLYRFDSVTNEITGLWRDCIIQGDIILSREDKTELPLRSSGYYDILICKITIPAGATEITQDMIGDFRQNEYYCGYAKNLLVDIDETLTKSDAAADAAAVGTVISNLRKETRTRDIITEKRITNLEQGLPAERWSVDDSVAYIKEVPENALPFASVDMIGGMTRKCANLIPPKNDIGTIRGLSFTNNADGSITVNGTATHNIYLNLADFYNLDGEYYISGCPAGGSIDTYRIIVDENNKGNAYDIGEGARFTAKKGNVYSILISVLEGVTLTNAVFKPMLNRGTTALPYEPYFDGLRSAPVTEMESVGVNLFDRDALTYSTEWKYMSIRAKPYTTYIATGDIPYYNMEGIYAFNSTTLADVANQIIAGKKVYITTNYDGIIKIQYRSGANVSVPQHYFQITEGTVVLPYTPYRRNTLPIPAEVQALDGYGVGTTDVGYNAIRWNDNGKCSYTQDVTRSVTIDGTEGGAKDTGYANTYIISKSVAFDGKEIRRVSYDVYPYNSANDIGVKNGVCVTENNIYITYERFTDDETIKAILLAHPIHLIASLAEPVITDISDLLPDDNLIGVVGGGTVTPVNKHGYAVPSKITYQLKGAEA